MKCLKSLKEFFLWEGEVAWISHVCTMNTAQKERAPEEVQSLNSYNVSFLFKLN